MLRKPYRKAVRAQLLIVPLLFYSCSGGDAVDILQYADSTATMVSYEHVMIYSGNGRKSYRMYAKEIRRFEYASRPYTLYPSGVQVNCYSDTAPDSIIADFSAKFAILWEDTNTWEARDSVVGNNYLENKHFKTDLLFWDQSNGLVFNDHNTHVEDGENKFDGCGFQTDEGFETWRFNRSTGRMNVKIGSDSTANADTVHMEVPGEETHL